MRYIIIFGFIGILVYFIISFKAYRQRFPHTSWWTYFFPVILALLLSCGVGWAVGGTPCTNHMYIDEDNNDECDICGLDVSSKKNHWETQIIIIDTKNTKWLGVPFGTHNLGGGIYEMGLREDGVMVWREIKEAK